MKKSMYTIIEKINNNTYLFYNTKTGFLRLYNTEQYNNYLNNNFGSQFNKFLVYTDYDEFKEVANYRISYINKAKDYIRFTIFPTMKCNAYCKFCYENGEIRNDMSKEIVDKTIAYIKSEAMKYKKLRIYWFGGEPFTRLDIMQYITDSLVNFCEQEQISYKASVATNMSLLNESNFDSVLSNLKIDKVEFAFDGVGKEHNESKNYSNKNFNAYEHNRKMLPKLLEKGIVVQLRLNCTVDNFEELSDLLEELLQLYGMYDNFIPYFAIIFPTACFQDNGSLIKKQDLAYYKLKIIEIMQKYKNTGMEAFPLGQGVINCYGSNPNSLVIGVDGLIAKCQGCSNKIDQSIGDVNKGINKNINYYNWCYCNTLPECSTCQLYPICLGGCTDSIMSNKKLPCIKEKYYINDLLQVVGNYMITNNILEYQYPIDKF